MPKKSSAPTLQQLDALANKAERAESSSRRLLNAARRVHRSDLRRAIATYEARRAHPDFKRTSNTVLRFIEKQFYSL